ncbi:hypothetical protein Pelo_16996 [Pelomyxa schiedti]|nr:hypothetical protein Pelo_16996 [Pelomyxa schiedti]
MCMKFVKEVVVECFGAQKQVDVGAIITHLCNQVEEGRQAEIDLYSQFLSRLLIPPPPSISWKIWQSLNALTFSDGRKKSFQTFRDVLIERAALHLIPALCELNITTPTDLDNPAAQTVIHDSFACKLTQILSMYQPCEYHTNNGVCIHTLANHQASHRMIYTSLLGTNVRNQAGKFVCAEQDFDLSTAIIARMKTYIQIPKEDTISHCHTLALELFQSKFVKPESVLRDTPGFAVRVLNDYPEKITMNLSPHLECVSDSFANTQAGSEDKLPARAPPRVLSLDGGGGVRGIVQVVMPRHIMQQMNLTKLSQLFDLVGGVGTGGITAFALGSDIVDIAGLMKFYTVDYPGLYRSLQKMFGNTWMHENRPDGCKVFSIARPEQWSHPVLFSNYRISNHSGIATPYRNAALMWKAAAATSATYYYFDPVTIGTAHSSSTPSINETQDSERYYDGSDIIEAEVAMKQFGTFHKEFLFPLELAHNNEVHWMSLLVYPEPVHTSVEEQMKNPYFRLNPPLSFDCAPDDIESISKLITGTEEYMTTFPKFKEMCLNLLATSLYVGCDMDSDVLIPLFPGKKAHLQVRSRSPQLFSTVKRSSTLFTNDLRVQVSIIYDSQIKNSQIGSKFNQPLAEVPQGHDDPYLVGTYTWEVGVGKCNIHVSVHDEATLETTGRPNLELPVGGTPIKFSVRENHDKFPIGGSPTVIQTAKPGLPLSKLKVFTIPLGDLRACSIQIKIDVDNLVEMCKHVKCQCPTPAPDMNKRLSQLGLQMRTEGLALSLGAAFAHCAWSNRNFGCMP